MYEQIENCLRILSKNAIIFYGFFCDMCDSNKIKLLVLYNK